MGYPNFGANLRNGSLELERRRQARELEHTRETLWRVFLLAQEEEDAPRRFALIRQACREHLGV